MPQLSILDSKSADISMEGPVPRPPLLPQVHEPARIDSKDALEDLIYRLPLERPPVQARGEIYALLELNPAQVQFLARAATEANASLEDILPAGFTGLLSRLTWQEKITLVCPGPLPSIATFTWERGLGFAAALSTRQSVRLPEGEHVPNGVTWQFLRRQSGDDPARAGALGLTATEHDAGLNLVLSSSVGRWSQSTLGSWLKLLRSLLLAAAQSPGMPLGMLPLLDEAEVLDLYRRLNRTASEYDAHACVHDLIARQARRNPDAVAVKFAGRQLTYSDLDRQSTLRAQHLASIGAGPDRPVAICMERSEQLPVALLAVLKSGSCYVPLDPNHPRQRLVSTLEECKPVAVLSDSLTAPSLGDLPAPVLCMDSDWPSLNAASQETITVSPDNLAYIIYTSGSTGRPKGVPIRHRSLVNLFDPHSRMPQIRPGDRLLAITTISFDIASMDMLMPLASGATLVIADRFAAGDAFELARRLDENDITVMQATPFTWRLLVNSGWTGKSGLRIISGGEALPRDLANQLLPLVQELWNCYGPTETAIYSSAICLQPGNGIVPLGPPIANTAFYIVDEAGKPLPPGVPGELCIGGVGLSPGYLLRPELTARRFISNPFSSSPGATLFRTGDLVRVLDDHGLEFMGRLDHQVKLRGYRIELSEIESVLRAHSTIENAAVILREDVGGEPRLVAYVTLKPSNRLHAKEVKDYLGRYLPEYMLPSRIVSLDALPLTGSGKIDRRALPIPESLSSQDEGLPQAANVAPGNEFEAKLLNIFREVLGQPSIGVTDNFFDYGGYSLLTARLFERIHRAFGRRLPISLLFDAPTPRQLAEIIRKGESLSMVVPIRKEGRAAPLFVIHSYLIYAALCEAIEEDRPIFGVRELEDEPIASLEERAAQYANAINQAYPAGPLSLVGWCLAGALTVEVARQLREQGRIVAVVALFDAERPGYRPQSADGGSLLKARARTFASFHSDRLRELDWPGRIKYFPDRIMHRWDQAVIVFPMRRRAAIRWVERKLGFMLPVSWRRRLSTLGADQLVPGKMQSYPGKIVLFRASDVAKVAGTEPSLGWNGVARDGVIVKFAPGDHESMFQKPHLPQFGEMLENVLHEGEASCSDPQDRLRAG